MGRALHQSEPVAIVDNRDGTGDMLLVCEHASNRFPDEFGMLGLTDAERRAHIAWDPGALGLARGLSSRLDACLVHANVSRLIYDLNPPAPRAGGDAGKKRGI